MAAVDFKLSDKAKRTPEQPITFLLEAALKNPDLISLAAGLVDNSTLPTEDVTRLVGEVLGDSQAGRAPLQYGMTDGLVALRRQLLSHLSELEGATPEAMHLSVENCVVTNGSQQGIYILADCLVNPGDIVIAGAPSYFVYTGVLQSFGADVRTVELDEDGMRTDLLAELLAKLDADGELDRVKMLYVVSYYQNPSGISLSADRRRELVELVKRYSKRHRILILEDAAYRELRYDGPVLPSIQSFDRENAFVASAMTFDKPFAAGLKTGYMFVPDSLIQPMVNQKGNHDFGTASLGQFVLSQAMADGTYARQVERVRASYKQKRDVILAAMDEHLAPLGDLVMWTKPAGGLYVWVSLGEGLDTRRDGALFNRCIDKGVLYVPGDYCYSPQADRPTPTRHMRLSFGAEAPDALREGIRRLAEAIAEQAESQELTGTGRRAAS